MKQSESYIEFKNRIQEIFNFAVLITLSVPVLKRNLKLFNDGTIPRLPEPDFFEPSVMYEIKQHSLDELTNKGIDSSRIEQLSLLLNIPLNNKEFKDKTIQILGEEDYKKYRNIFKLQSSNYIENISNCTANYQSKLATYLYFSAFSYFEAFILDLAKEIIDNFATVDKNQYINDFALSNDKEVDMTKLDKKFDSGKIGRYEKYSKIIRSKGYINPEKLMFSTLTDIYNTKIDNLKANEIPDFLEKTLLFIMTPDEKETFHSIRNNRNSIGHGENSYSPCLNDVINANKFFKGLSDRIDKHAIFYFSPLKNYKE